MNLYKFYIGIKFSINKYKLGLRKAQTITNQKEEKENPETLKNPRNEFRVEDKKWRRRLWKKETTTETWRSLQP